MPVNRICVTMKEAMGKSPAKVIDSRTCNSQVWIQPLRWLCHGGHPWKPRGRARHGFAAIAAAGETEGRAISSHSKRQTLFVGHVGQSRSMEAQTAVVGFFRGGGIRGVGKKKGADGCVTGVERNHHAPTACEPKIWILRQSMDQTLPTAPRSPHACARPPHGGWSSVIATSPVLQLPMPIMHITFG